LHRRYSARPVGGTILVIVAIAMSLVAGAFSVAAQADDVANPSGESSATADPQPTDPQATDPASPAATGSGLVRQLLGPGPTVRTAALPMVLGSTATLDLRPYVTCSGPTCTYAGRTAPSGWPVSVSPGGIMTIKVPKKTSPRAYNISYTVTDASGPAVGNVTIQVTPDSYNPVAGMVFSHPYRKHYRYKIRNRIERTINSVPPGSRIQVASWSFSSKTYRRALKKARHRGVVVQIVLAERNRRNNSDYRLLKKAFGTTVTANGSWVKRCHNSCRGVRGTMHSKIFLFSNAYRTPYVMMTGSANLTDFAVTNQWNQMNVVVRNKPVYDEGVRIFNQMVLDRRANPMYVQTTFPGGLTSYFYPTTSESTTTDFMYKALSHVQCSGAKNTGNGRTSIKIAMYAWYQERGKWLAKRVRQLWGQGCAIQIVYGISSDPVKKILYSPAGRGRIPMRQILLSNTKGVPIYYLHDKWVAITGNYAGVPNNSVSFHGSFNFSDLGFSSDEQFQMLPGRATYDRFARDFRLLWKDKQARAPSPVSKIPTIEGRYSENELRLGTGVYRYMDAD
jgi:hypothetical protein